MYRFTVSAPGTLLLCGEHNKTCVAAGLDMRTVLTFSSFPEARRNFIEINFSSIQLHIKIPLRIFLIHFYNINCDRTLARMKLFKKVKKFVTFLAGFPGNYESNNHAHQLSLQAFFFLLVFIGLKKGIIIKSSFNVELSTELPIGEGLGSSASFVVCLTACFWRWSLLQKGKIRNRFNYNDFENISKYAQICDNIVYNSSTNIDIVISMSGKIKIFKEKAQQIDHFPDVPSMKILLVFSNVSQKIERSLEIKMMEHLSSSVDLVLNGIETVSEKFIRTLRKIDAKTHSLKQRNIVETDSVRLIKYYKILIDLIHMNQGQLRALGITHPNLDIICAIARDKSLGGKIAASSGGGYAFILLLPNYSDEYIQDLINIYESHNFPAKVASLNCGGLRIE